jgi:hypothetical protein
MADELDLTTKDIPAAVNDALLRGHQLVVGYVDESGAPIVSFRGSVHVHGPKELAFWARKRDSGLAKAIETNPRLHLIYFEHEGPGPRFLSFKGSARVEPSLNDVVYAGIIEPEQNQDKERNGVAVIVDVDSVDGFATDGPFRMVR